MPKAGSEARYPPHMRFLLAHGPNLDLLGTRNPAVYGTATLADVEARVRDEATRFKVEVETFQTNHEGALIERLHAARSGIDGIILNAGGWTHTSIALRDALEAAEVPTVEIHLSNVLEREPFRHHSVLADVCIHTIYGRGIEGYPFAVHRLVSHLRHPARLERYGPLEDQRIELRTPEGPGPHPTVALLHGGFWRHYWTADTLDLLASDLPSRGLASANVEYRRVGTGGGPDATPSDVAAALRHLAADDAVDATRLAVVGHSAGGHLALWAAGRAGVPLRLAVSLAGVTDLERARREGLGNGAVDAFLGTNANSSLSPMELLPLGVPSLCVHGREDTDVPFAYSERFVDAARAAGDDATLLRGDGADHFAPIDPSHALWAETLAALLDALR